MSAGFRCRRYLGCGGSSPFVLPAGEPGEGLVLASEALRQRTDPVRQESTGAGSPSLSAWPVRPPATGESARPRPAHSQRPHPGHASSPARGAWKSPGGSRGRAAPQSPSDGRSWPPNCLVTHVGKADPLRSSSARTRPMARNSAACSRISTRGGADRDSVSDSESVSESERTREGAREANGDNRQGDKAQETESESLSRVLASTSVGSPIAPDVCRKGAGKGPTAPQPRNRRRTATAPVPPRSARRCAPFRRPGSGSPAGGCRHRSVSR